MNLEDVFWEMVAEAGSSQEELADFDVSWVFDAQKTEVTLFQSRFDDCGNRYVEEDKEPDGSAWQVKVVFDYDCINLSDPKSFQKLKECIKIYKGE